MTMFLVTTSIYNYCYRILYDGIMNNKITWDWLFIMNLIYNIIKIKKLLYCLDISMFFEILLNELIII